ncbi:MAG: Bax inhibitor-1/YccA family protein [Verrucomicrobia bacterium]|nr:Bax inhibitor-1/YccA family protein [Verrucomicrobiota bacterium]
MRTGNPTLNSNTFRVEYADSNAMTIGGTVNKTAILLLLVAMTAIWSWKKVMVLGDMSAMMPWVIGSAILGFIIALITIFKKTAAPITAPIYALVEGVFLGAISAIMELAYPGIVFQAITLTFGTLFALLAAYKSGLIKATENFKLGIVAATGGIMLIYLASFILGFFGVHMPYIHGSGPIGIGFSLIVVVIVALNLVLDFDFIEEGAERGAPRYMEWYGAFGLLVTLIWLYLEILRLLSKLRSR